MKMRIFTCLACVCGHRGAIVESFTDDRASANGWYQAWLQNLTHAGTYDGIDELFAETQPGCPQCGRSLGPENIVDRQVKNGTHRPRSSHPDAQFLRQARL